MEHLKKVCKIHLVCLWLTIFLITAIPRAYPGEVLSTTFNCSESKVSKGNYNPHCDAISLADLAASGSCYSQITSAANMTNGGGGRGFRYWVGNGKNNRSGTILLFGTKVSEFWVRFYMRIEKIFIFK